MIPKAPCLNCQNRHLGCHDDCEKYNAYRKEQDVYKELCQKERYINRIMDTWEFGRRRRK